jgi:hypothetical protein
VTKQLGTENERREGSNYIGGRAKLLPEFVLTLKVRSEKRMAEPESWLAQCSSLILGSPQNKHKKGALNTARFF